MVAVLLGLILVVVIIFLIMLYGWQEVHICGLVIKIKSGERMFRIKQIEHQSLPGLQVYRRTTQGSAGYTEKLVVTFQSPEQDTRTVSTKTDSNKETTSCDTRHSDESTDCSITIGRESFYENLAFEQEQKE